MNFASEDHNLLVMVDESFAKSFPRLTFLKRNLFKRPYNTVFMLGSDAPANFTIEATHEIKEQRLANVVGVLPGKSRKDEYVIFSGHYDHLGVGAPMNGDSIYNGANDDAAGTTAVIMLSKYFKALGGNERTIVFAAFTAEESGGFGSRYFSQQFDPAKVVAMFNIEMIGTESKWGKNSAYITGYEKTDMGRILEKNLAGTGFTFYPDPYPEQQLFYRSDNATLARQGVPAHTISTAKMDEEPHYHKASDQVETLDMANLAMIAKSIAMSARSIVAGKDTPSRVNTNELR
jgi:Zn-dependent M28 family amino/carboxypeptidase